MKDGIKIVTIGGGSSYTPELMEGFIINPLVENGGEAVKVLHELFVAHEKYLPQFAEVIQKLFSVASLFFFVKIFPTSYNAKKFRK